MKVVEVHFTDIHQKYLTIEVDELTEELKNKIDVHDDDCYALCSSYCADDGMLMFNVLSIGNSWETCLRGMDNPEMLGFFSMEQVFDCETRIAKETVDMVKKNASWLEKVEHNIDEDIRRLRQDERLDDLRDPVYPDRVVAGVMHEGSIYELQINLTGIQGPFVVGELDDEPDMEIGLHFADNVWAIPYFADGIHRLIILFGGPSLSKEESEVLEQIVAETEKLGFDFTGISMKS